MTTAQKILKIANENPLQKSDYTLKMYVGLKTLELMQVTLPFSRVIGQKHTVSLDNKAHTISFTPYSSYPITSLSGENVTIYRITYKEQPYRINYFPSSKFIAIIKEK